MEFTFRVFVQQHADGSVTLSVPALSGVQVFHPDRAQALAALQQDIVERLRATDRRSWGTLVFKPQQELRAIEVELQSKSKPPQPPITIMLNLLITTEQFARGVRYLIAAPRLPELSEVVDSENLIEPRAREAIQHLTRKWETPQIIAIDLAGSESLDVVTVVVPDPVDEPAADESLSNTHGQDNVLGLCGLSLTAQATRGKLGRADRRDALVESMVTTLAAAKLNSLMLVGRADVGKTALLHEVVERIKSGKVPPALRGREVWFVTANNLIAGMKYTGEWQGRTQKLIEQVRRGRQILYMADPNEILDAGRWSGSDNNMGRFLRPYLESGELTVICECAPEGFAAGMKVEPSFMNAFRRIDVAETDEGDTLAIVQGSARRLEAAHAVSVAPGATAAVLDLTRRFMPYRAFPGKAVRFLEEMVRDALAVSAEKGIAGHTFERSDVIASFTAKTGLPAFMLSDETALRVPEARAYFEERLLGQPEAVEAMVDLITVIKAGLNDPNKPLGTFFFVGPTGVGKTELAKVLAEFLFGSRERMIRFDMSEYAAADALLGVLGEGRLTDTTGRTADFRNAIIIMTSNLGASRREMQTIGFGQSAPDGEDALRLRDHFIKEAERFFRPEFFNRIDRIVAFRPLTLDAVRLITRRELGKLLMREGVVRRNLLVEIDDAVIEKLLQQGFHPLYGARPLQREIERAVILPLARLILDQGADHNTLLRFSVRDERIHLSLVPLDVPDEAGEALPATPTVDKKLETDLSAVLRAIGELRERVAGEEATPVVRQLRREAASLLARTREPTFWDEPITARDILSQVYHLERVLKRLDTLAERVEFLEEKGRQVRVHRDRRSVPGLARDVESLSAEFAYLQMELAGAGVGRGLDAALLRVAPLSRDAELWASQLLAMYTAWAGRKGYEYNVVDLADGGEKRGGHNMPPIPALYLSGSYIYEFLLGEAGLHKLNTTGGEERQRTIARVTVLPVAGVALEEDAVQLRAALSGLLVRSGENSRDDASAVVRIYNQGRHRFVRDPRTGVRLPDSAAVLSDGQIDAFLLASLRQRAEAAVGE